jgi:integrase
MVRRGRVSRRVEAFLKSAQATNTVRAYASDIEHFRKWGGRIPARAEVVAEYLADLARARTFATIARRKAAIAAAHRQRGYRSPCDMEIVRATLAGIRRTAKRGAGQMRPLMTAQLVATVKAISGDVRGSRDKAILLIGFAGAFRRSELASINVEDCGMRGAELVIRLRKSKTDQEGRGREVVIPPAIKGVCPIKAVRAWLERANIRTGALFRSIHTGEIVTQRRLPSGEVARIVKARMAGAGFDPRGYGAHSLRAGYVTSAALQGVPMWQIKRQTGHSRETMVETYIRPVEALECPRLL